MGLNASGEQDFPDTDDDITTVSDESKEIVEDETTNLDANETELDDDDSTDDDSDDTSSGDTDAVDSDSDSSMESEEDTSADATEQADADTQNKGDEPETKKKKRKRFNSEEYSRGVQKRINREVRKREELRAENNALQARMDKLEQSQVAEKNTQEQQLMVTRIQNAQSMHNQLMEDGEYQQATRVNNDIMDMKLYQRDLENDALADEAEAEDRVVPNAAPDIPSAQIDWMQGNERFNRDVGYTAYVNEEYDKLVDEGYDPEDQSLYDKLDKVISRNVQSKPKAKPRRQAAPPPNSGTTPAGSSTNSRLTKSDLGRMEDWGLDSKDPAARKEWLSNKSA